MHIILEKHFRWLPFEEKGGVSSLSSRFPYTHRVFSGSTFWKKSWWREHHHLPHAEFPFPLLVLLRWFLPPNHDVTLLRGIHSYFAFSNKIIHTAAAIEYWYHQFWITMIGWWKLWKEKVSEKLKVEIKLLGNIALRPMSRIEVVWVWRAITSREIWSDFISAPRKVWSTYCFRLKDLFGFFLRLCCCSYHVWGKRLEILSQIKKKTNSNFKGPTFFSNPVPFFIFSS